jgi:alpha-1,2-mannosyltransferase
MGLHRRLGVASRNRALTLGLFLEAPLIFIGFYVWLVGLKGGWRMQDFMTLRDSGHALLHGASPYPPAEPKVLLAANHLVYPPLAGYLFTPFSALPYAIAGPLYFFASVAAVAGTLWVLGVRDWRCYGMPFLWYPTVACLGTGALGPLLALLLAVAWRYRNRPIIVAPALALAVVLKLFLWPLGIWLVATRRWQAAALAAATAAVALVAPFSPLGAKTLQGYPHLLRVLDQVFGPASFSSNTFFRSLGASAGVAQAMVLVVGVTLVVTALVLGLRRGSDRRTLTVTLLAALLTSPIVWMHYYVLLIVPLALARPRLSALWFAPLLYWASPMLESLGDLRRLLVGLGVTAVVAVATMGKTVRATSSVAPSAAG